MPFAVTRGDIDVRSARPSQLDRDMSRCSEAIDAEPRTGPSLLSVPDFRKAQSAIADDPCAKKRRSLQVVETLRQRVGKCRGCDRIFGVATVNCPPCELRLFAQVLATGRTEPTHTVGP